MTGAGAEPESVPYGGRSVTVEGDVQPAELPEALGLLGSLAASG
jgi:hypothetical protein